jgi:hypothetical protein
MTHGQKDVATTHTHSQSLLAVARDDVDEMLRSGDPVAHMEESIAGMNLSGHEQDAFSLYAQSRQIRAPPQGWSTDQ